MEKHTWNKVNCNLKSSSHPSPRWGHSSCIVGDCILYFGGYADSTYMNDLWSFNTLTMNWTEIQTSGIIPQQRSNSSMCYDEKNNHIVVFGGGAPNKKRFNSIHLLDWNTKQWSEIQPKENQQAPWQRTYHTSELFYPYLVVFGGEGVTDLDDVWTFNFETLSWKEISLEKDSPKPCARRFHSSVKIGNQFFVIAGCHGKYRCLNDIYSIDLSEMLNNANFTLRWRERKFNGSTFLTRWGQSSAVFEGKIYIFGGRFSNDLSDILIADLEKETMKAMKTKTEIPKARRRHSACFVGSNMIVFGGFNGEYFNDLYYINVFETKKKIEARTSNTLSKATFAHLLGNQQFSDGVIISLEKIEIPIHKALIRRYFSCEQKMEQFLQELNSTCSKTDILEILSYFYRGYSQEEFDSKHLLLSESFEISLPESENEKENQFFKKLLNESKEFLSIAPKKSNIMTVPVISLAEDEYINFLDIMKTEIYCDASIVFNQECYLPVSKSLLKINSEYFNALFSSKFSENNEIYLHWNCSKISMIAFEAMINYLYLGRVVISKEFALEHWIELARISEYYCLNHLLEICEQQLLPYVNDYCESLMSLAFSLNLKALADHCAQNRINLMVKKEEICKMDSKENQKLNQKRQKLLKYVYGLLKFDILQNKIESQNRVQNNFKKKNQECEEKENQQKNIEAM